MTHHNLVKLCLKHPNTYKDQPFKDPAWTVVRHRQNRKVFAWVYRRQNRLYINLKCEPIKADFLRQLYKGITPGYHLNKTHWNTVDPGLDVPLPQLESMIEESYRLTAPRKPKSKETPHGMV